LLVDDRRPKKKQRRDEGARRFIELEAEEDSEDYDEGDDYGEEQERGGTGHESQYYRPEEL
jgi:hypothetical protein